MDNEIHHREDTKLYTFDLTLKGTAHSILVATKTLFESGSSPAELDGEYAYPTTYKDGESCSTAITVLFENVGGSASNTNIHAKSCIATGMELAQSSGSNGGELTVVIHMASGYQPVYNTLTPTSPSTDTGTPKNIFDISTSTITPSGGSAETVFTTDWSLSVARNIERIGFKDTTDWEPFGLAMTGVMEVTGSLTVKRDSEFDSLQDSFHGGTLNALSLIETNFTLSIPKLIFMEPSTDKGGNILMSTMPFRAVGQIATPSSNIVSITTS